MGGALTDLVSWRWCLYVNLAFAVPAAIAAFTLLHNQRPATRPKVDIPGTIAASVGLFSLVYGFSNAETHSWGDPLTVGFLAAGVVLLAVFVAIQRRVQNPLLPLRVVLDRDRGGSYLAVGAAGAGMFGVFLFLTYYMQQTLGFSPLETGVAFLPLCISILLTAVLSSTKILPRTGPRPLIPLGMTLAAVAMVLLTNVGVDTAYGSHVLPSLIIAGVGFGLIMAPAMNTATLGVRPSDSGVASAMVNVGQQVGGSIGTALLSTLASSATTSFATGKVLSPDAMAGAAVHGYTTAFWWSAAIFAVGAVTTALLLRPGVPQLDASAEPVLAH
jgi:predicted MFS family arabinose efflux permease